MNNSKTRRLTNLIWVENKGYWIHHCQNCRKTSLEPRKQLYE